jgi:hypothetical protein
MMADDTVYEVDVHIRSATGETVKNYEVPLSHATVDDVAADLKGTLDSRSGNKVRTISPDR